MLPFDKWVRQLFFHHLLYLSWQLKAQQTKDILFRLSILGVRQETQWFGEMKCPTRRQWTWSRLQYTKIGVKFLIFQTQFHKQSWLPEQWHLKPDKPPGSCDHYPPKVKKFFHFYLHTVGFIKITTIWKSLHYIVWEPVPIIYYTKTGSSIKWSGPSQTKKLHYDIDM